MDVRPRASVSGFSVGTEHIFKELELIGFFTEVREMICGITLGFLHSLFHFGTIKPVKCIALDECSLDLLTEKDLRKGIADR